MLKLFLMATGLSFPTIAIANGLKQSTNLESFLLTTFLTLLAMAVLTQLGFYWRHILKPSETK